MIKHENNSPYRQPLITYALLVWFVVSLLSLVLVLPYGGPTESTLALFRSRYLIAVGGLGILTGVAAIIFMLHVTRRLPVLKLRLLSTNRFGWGAAIGNIALITVAWIGLQPGTSIITSLAIFRLYVVGMLCALAVVILIASRTLTLPVSPQWTRIIGVSASVVTVILAALYIGKIPAIAYFDESVEMNLGLSMVRTGSFHSSIFPMLPPPTIIAVYHATLFHWLAGVWMELVGIGLTQVRLFFLIGMWISVPFVYLTSRRLYGNQAGIAAATIAALVPLTHDYIRPDAFVATMTAVALYLFFLAREHNKLWQHYLTGLTIALAIEGHPYGVSLAVGLGLIYLFQYVHLVGHSRRWQWNPAFWCFVLGGATYVVIFYLIYRAPMFSMASGELAQMVYEGQLFDKDSTFLSRIALQTVLFYRDYLLENPLEVLLGVAAIIAALWRSKTQDQLLVVFWLLSLLVLSAIMVHKNPYYWIYNLPFLAILGGAFLMQVGKVEVLSKRSLTLGAWTTTLSVIVLFTTNAIITGNRTLREDRLYKILREIHHLLPPDVTVHSWPGYFVGLPEHNLVVSTLDTDSPLQAVIVTRGRDDSPQIYQRIQASGLAKAYCSDPIVLYLPKTNLPLGAPFNCPSE